MRNLTLRLILISGFLLLTCSSLFSQCRDTQPVVIGPDVVRAGQTVTYMTNAIPGHTYSWSISGGGSISGSNTLNQVTVVWGSIPTTSTITISEKNSADLPCAAVPVSKTITIQPLLHAYYYYQFDPTGGCYYNVVNFTADPNVSIHPNDPNVTYTWDFGDGSGIVSGTGAAYEALAHTFPTTSGVTYPVTFSVTDQAGDVDQIIDYVYVDPDKFKPTADITSITPPATNCLYNQYTFSASGSLPKPVSNTDPSIMLKYCDWYVDGVLVFHSGNGTTFPCSTTATYVFPAPGTYTLTLTIQNTINCTNTTTTTVIVDNTIPAAAFTFTQACMNEATPFTDESLANTGSITDWWWTWNDGSGTEHYQIPGNPPPTPVTHIFTDLLLHNVTLKVMNSNGCENTTSLTPVQAAPSPKADFTYPIVICDGDAVQFIKMSSPLTGSPIVSYLWNFDDPSSSSNTSTDSVPQHLFSGPGSYHVSLTVTNQSGCSNTKTLTTTPLVVSPHPFIDYTFTFGTVPYQVHFHDTINAAQNVGNNLRWDFGDGTNTYGSDPTHIFPGAGAFTVRCTATDMITGCSKYIEYNLGLGSPPSAFFTANPQQQCENQPIVFVPGPPGGMIDTEDWDFGDGSAVQHYVFPNTPASPTHTYTTEGPYHVIRILNSGTIMEAQFDLWVTIYPSPTAQFTWFSDPSYLHQWKACDGQPVYFLDESYSNSTPTGTIYQWLWNFDDPMSGTNNTSTLQNPSHIFLSGKTSYNVTLTVTDNLHDCQSSPDLRNVPISTPIPVEFSYNNNVCLDHLVNFTTDAVALPPANYTWLWDFGDGQTSATPGSVSHLYASVNNFTVTLTLTDTISCTKSKQHVVAIIPKPITNFTFTTPTCFGQTIQFTDLSTVPLPYNDIIVSWDWDFGDGSAHSALRNPGHLYAIYSPAGYNVILTVTTNRGCSDTKTINVQQIASPLADFQVTGGTYSCVTPQSVHFSDLSQTNGGGNLMSWSWDFGDPASGAFNFSTTQNPSHIYNTSGAKTVTLIVTNTNYCTDTIIKTITINSLPAPDFTFSTSCLGNNTLFTDATVPNASGILSWAWDFGDGGTSPLQNPQHLFATAGAHTVTLVVVNSNGCTNTITRTVTVNPKPVVDFISTSPFCQHAQVIFTSQAYVPTGFTSFINNWVWKFGDGTANGSGPVVTHTYLDAPISHTVTLITTTTDGCVDSISKVVTGISSPIANFTYLGVGCLNQSLSFVDNSQTNGGGTISQWAWNFDDPGSGSSNTSTLQNPTHSFTSVGIHHVTLTVTNVSGCTNQKIIDVTISAKPVAAFTTANSCLGNLTVFTDGSTPSGTIVTWAWDFGDGGTSSSQNPTYAFSIAGIHYVTLTVTNANGCTQSITNPVQVYPQPVTSFKFSSPTCAGGTVTFTDMSTTGHGFIHQRTWHFGDGGAQTTTTSTVTHTYTNGGLYQVTLTVTTSDSCTGTEQLPVSVQYQPVAAFTVSNSLCTQAPVQFTDNSQNNGGGQITQWTWNFGDPGSGANNTSTQQSPVHNFSAAGTFTVHLIVANADGCSDTTSQSVIINVQPTADFIYSTGCKGSPTLFTDKSTGGTIVTWSWNFGDGGSSTAQQPSYTYANAGTYSVILIVTTSNGCANSITKQVVIYATPVSQFSFSSPTCSSDSVQFTDLSTTAHGSVHQWDWDFGDGGTTSIVFPASPNVKHKYAHGGTFNVKLKITTTDSCTNDITIPVPVEYQPVANFSNSAGVCAQMPDQFTDLSQANGGKPIVSWLWNFGDPTSGSNNTSTQKNPTHAFSAAGTFSVKLMVTNATGCFDTLSKQITANAAPVPLFTFDTACMSSPTQFHDISTTSSGTINAWLWTFGDPSSGTNNTSTLQNPTHNYSVPGNYMVTLMVTNTNNCSHDTIKQISVSPKPQALFQYTAACAEDSTGFTDLSTAPNSQLVAWLWNFGDGGTAAIKNPKHKYAAAGTYSVKEVITNLNGCKDSVTQSVIVHPKPVAAFQYTSKYCPKGQVTFQDESTASAAVIVDHLWIFEPGGTSTVPNPVYTFPVTDTTYAVTLIVTDNNGCKDTIIDSVKVKPAFHFSFTNDTVCLGYLTHFHPVNYNTGQDSLYSPRWDFGDPNSGPANNSSLYNTSHIFTAPGLYYVKLKVFNSDNCIDSVFKTVQVYALPKPHFTYTAPQCDSILHFIDTTSNYGTGTIASWEWRFGDGSSPLIIPAPGPGDTSHIYSASGNYQVTLIITNTHGCVDSITQGVTRLPCIRADYDYPDTLRCMNYMVAFHDTSVPSTRIKEWKWTWDDGTDTTYTTYSKYVKHEFTNAGTYNVKLWITTVVNTVNINDSITQQVVIHPTPQTMFSDIAVCLHQPAIFKDTSLTNGEAVSAWSWNFGEPSSGVNNTSIIRNPIHTYATRDTFNVKLMVMNKYGCKDSLTKPIRIYGLPVAGFKYTAACTGDPTYFRDSSSIADTTIGFWRWNFGTNLLKDTSVLKDPSFKYKTAGNYMVRLIIKDHFGCKDTVDSTVLVHVTPVSSFTLVNGYEGTPGKIKLNNQSTGASGYSWDFGNGKTSNDTNPVASYTEDGTYTIRLISTTVFGCTDTTYYEYKILFRGLFVPNAFAPNSGNMAVRLFKPVGINLKTYHIQVFDSWGHLMWESNSLDNNGTPLEGWDGTYNGALMPQGNYFWKVTATFIDDSPWTGSDIGVKGGNGTMGSVILLR